jgi:hypothetical protein
MKAIIPILFICATIKYFTRPNENTIKELSLKDELESMDRNELNKALEYVVNEERYELACVIRDFINEKYG